MAKTTRTTKTTRKTKNQKTAKTAKISVPKDDLGFIDDLPENDKRIAGIYIKMKEYYGDNLANFEHQPRVFAHQYRMFQYYKLQGGAEQ